MCGTEYRTSAVPIYQRHKLMKLNQINQNMVSAYAFNSLQNDLPISFELREQTHQLTVKLFMEQCGSEICYQVKQAFHSTALYLRNTSLYQNISEFTQGSKRIQT